MYEFNASDLTGLADNELCCQGLRQDSQICSTGIREKVSSSGITSCPSHLAITPINGTERMMDAHVVTTPSLNRTPHFFTQCARCSNPLSLLWRSPSTETCMDWPIRSMATSIIRRFKRDIWFSRISRGIIKMLMLCEVWEQIFKSPTFVSKFLPVVIVKLMASHIHLVIDSTRPASPLPRGWSMAKLLADF